MKKSLTILFLTIFSLANANTVETLSKDVSNVVDSVKVGVTETVSYVDTSSNFKRIYNDLYDGIIALAAGLKVGAEHVYAIIVKQQIVNSIVYLLVLLLGTFSIHMCYKQWGLIKIKKEKYTTDVEEIRPLAFTIIFGVLAFILLLAGLLNLNTLVMGFLNPEYGAIMDIVRFVNKLK
jgi:hypothetical protein